jgi:hypothetical protein
MNEMELAAAAVSEAIGYLKALGMWEQSADVPNEEFLSHIVQTIRALEQICTEHLQGVGNAR